VFTLLDKKNGKVARKIYAGSEGKSTDILSPDFDVVIFLNNKHPPFEDVLDDFENILTLNSSKIKSESLKQTKISLQFQFENGMEVDLLPATNFVKEHDKRDNHIQQSESVKKLTVDPKKARAYSSSLGESQVQFMKERSAFTHQVRSSLFIDKLFSKIFF
jgi:hypothetical protein